MAEVLNDCLELSVSEQVGGEACRVQALLEIWLERMDDESHFEIRVGSEHLSRVNSSHLERPVVNDHDLVSKIYDVHVGELLVEVGDSFLGEVSGDVEEAICHKEVGICLLNVAFNGSLEVLGHLVEVTSLVDHLRE